MAGKKGRSGRRKEATTSSSAAFPPMADGDAPDWLNEIGRRKWTELVGTLSLIEGLLSEVDRGVLAMYCEAFGEFRLVSEELGANWVVYSDKGSAYLNPLVGVKNKALERMRSLSRELGLTPSARATLKLESGGTPDDEESKAFARLYKLRAG